MAVLTVIGGVDVGRYRVKHIVTKKQNIIEHQQTSKLALNSNKTRISYVCVKASKIDSNGPPHHPGLNEHSH